MFRTLERNIKNGIVGDIAYGRVGIKKECELTEKLSKNVGPVYPFSSLYVWRDIRAERISERDVDNHSEVRFRRVISPRKCFEHIETWIKFKNKETHPESKHNNPAESNCFKTSFDKKNIGTRIIKELDKIYTIICENSERFQEAANSAICTDIEITYIHEIFFTEDKLPVMVTAIEIKTKYY